MNLMFWKKKATSEDSEDDSQEEPGDKSASRKSPGHASRQLDKSEDTHGETVDVSPSLARRRLIIGAVIGALIMSAIGVTIWKVFLPSPKENTATADTPASIQPNPPPERQLKKLSPIEFLHLRKAQSKDRQSDIEALKKKNNELPQIEVPRIEPAQIESPPSVSRQAEIESLKKKNDELQTQIGVLESELSQVEKSQRASRQAEIEILRKKNDELQSQIGVLREKQQQHSSASPANQAAQPTSPSGDIAIGNKNPKATAQTLKEAIEVMNANSGEPPKKAAK